MHPTTQIDDVWPVDITLHEVSGKLGVLWSDGHLSNLAGDVLRNACRCAICEQQRRTSQPVNRRTGVLLTRLHAIGDMGLQLSFSDDHDCGIYPWPYLRELSITSPEEA
jgi:DUF971 family protein